MEPTAAELSAAVGAEGFRRLELCIAKIEHCLSQLDDEQLWWRPLESMNSIANLILHLCGNVRQWIVHGIGGEPDIRDRPSEFSAPGPISRSELLQRLDQLKAEAGKVLSSISPEEQFRPRRIQGFDTTGLRAIFDSVTHFTGHTQEIICLTRMQLGEDYRFQWTPSTPEEGTSV